MAAHHALVSLVSYDKKRQVSAALEQQKHHLQCDFQRIQACENLEERRAELTVMFETLCVECGARFTPAIPDAVLRSSFSRR